MSSPVNGQQFKYYHGSVARMEAGTEILPPSRRDPSIRANWPNASMSEDHAYASESEDNAWEWAERAWNVSPNGHPRVYEVEPLGQVEPDERYDAHGNLRDIFEGDVRAPGFRVLGERPMPEHLGPPEDWQ